VFRFSAQPFCPTELLAGRPPSELHNHSPCQGEGNWRNCCNSRRIWRNRAI